MAADSSNFGVNMAGNDNVHASNARRVIPSSGSMDDVAFSDGRGGELRRDRPYSASMASRKSTVSTTSRASLNPTLVTTEYSAKSMFSYREGLFEQAIKNCSTSVLKPSLDGDIKGSWLLTEIDHWDMEKEKIVLLTTNSLLIVKYDFIRVSVVEFKRIMMRSIERVQIGDFVYPQYSIMPLRNHGGLRVYWGTSQPSLAQLWNPFCQDVGFISLTHHPLLYSQKEKETTTFNVNDMSDTLIQTATEWRQNNARQEAMRVDDGPITIESYASLTSLVFNQSQLFLMQVTL